LPSNQGKHPLSSPPQSGQRARRPICSDLPEISPLDEKRVGYRIERWEKPVEADMPILTDDYAPVEGYVAGIEG